MVIGVHRHAGDYLGAPGPETVIHAHDTLVLYGRTGRIAELDQRRHGVSGDEAHARASAEEREVERAEA